MLTLRTVAELRGALAQPRREGRTIGFVPTMGALHAGHLSLVEQARGDCDLVVLSSFVNPTQFDDRRDLDAYPRDDARDAALARDAGVDVLFSPTVDEVYPPGFATTVSVAGLTETLEGRHRGRAHFDGVATVVTKLLNMVGPDVAYFGQKDAQQALVVRRLVRDLDIPVQIEVCPTVRDNDGLALSSRNAHLSTDDRRRALALPEALSAVEAAVSTGERDAAALRALAVAKLRERQIEPEYVELVDPETFEPVARVDGETLIALAARVGSTRLIDNTLLTTNRST